MKKVISLRDGNIVLKCIAMSHSSVGGEYEIKLSKKQDYDLESMLNSLEGSAFELEEIKERSLSLRLGEATITILKKGNILIQDLIPDTYEKAITIGEELINAEQLGTK